MRHDDEFALILNQTIKIGRRSGYTTTAMGQKKTTGETIIAPLVSVYFEINPKGYVWEAPGQMIKVDYRMLAKYDTDIQPGDMIYPLSGIVGLTFGRVVGIETIMQHDGLSHHVEALIERAG